MKSQSLYLSASLEIPFQTTVFSNILDLVGWVTIDSGVKNSAVPEVSLELVENSSSTGSTSDRYFVLDENPKDILVLKSLTTVLKNESFKINEATNGKLYRVDACLENNVRNKQATYKVRLAVKALGYTTFSSPGTVTFALQNETGCGGPLTAIPNVIRDKRIILDFWAIGRKEAPNKFKLELETESQTNLKNSSLSYGIFSEELRNKWPDSFDSSHLAGQLILESEKGLGDISVSIVDPENKLKIFFGNTSHEPADRQISEIVGYGIDQQDLNIDGILLSEKPENPEIFVVTSREIRLLEEGSEISWYQNSLDETEFGAMPWRRANRFRIKFPIRSLHNFPGSIGLRFRIGSTNGDFGSYIEKSLTSLANSFLEQQIDDDQGLLKKGLRKISKIGFIPNKTISLVEPREKSESKNILFGFHNFSDTEGAPKVFERILYSVNEHLTLEYKPFVIGLREGPIKKSILEKNISCFDLYEGSLIDLKTSGYIDAFNKAVEILKEVKPKLVFTNSIDSFILIDAAWRLDIPTLMLVHESINPELHYYEKELWIRQRFLRSLDKVDKLIFVSDKTRKLYRSLVSLERTRVIRNGINKSEFTGKLGQSDSSKIRSQYKISDQDLVFLSVGTTTARKGQDRTIRELAELSRLDPKLRWKFLIVGGREIPFKGYLIEKIKNLGLEDRVVIVDETGDVLPFYKIADAFILNSKEESSPLVILEAFAAKIPVFSTEVFGLSEILKDNKNSIVFDGEVVGDLAAKLLKFFEVKDLSMVEYAYAQLDKDFSEEASLKKYQDLILELL